LFYPPSGEYFPRKASTHQCTRRLKINKNSTFTIIEWTGGQDRLQCTKEYNHGQMERLYVVVLFGSLINANLTGQYETKDVIVLRFQLV
jgi:hypothetical protein